MSAVQAQTKLALLRQAVQIDPSSAALLYRLADALADAGENREAADAFRRAYVLEPSSEVILPLDGSPPDGDVTALRDRITSLVRHGAAFSPVIAALAVLDARLGNRTAVRRLLDYDRFFRSYVIDPPAGHDLANFNRALAAEVKATGLTFYDAQTKRPLHKGWRSDGITRSELPNLRIWKETMLREIARYLADLPHDPDHPFLAARPDD